MRTRPLLAGSSILTPMLGLATVRWWIEAEGVWGQRRLRPRTLSRLSWMSSGYLQTRPQPDKYLLYLYMHMSVCFPCARL